MKLFFKLFIPIAFLAFISCKKDAKNPSNISDDEYVSTIQYAKGFEIFSKNGQKMLLIKTPYQNAKEQFSFVLTDKTNLSEHTIKVPVKSIIATSTTHIPMLELLDAHEKLKGFPNTKFISSQKTRDLISRKKIIDLGFEQNINTEKILELSPELVIGFGVNENNKTYKNIQKAGIPIIYNGDWLEETPLGRAEWIKFFGVLLGKEKEADSIFNSIKKSYLEAKNAALKAKKRPTVIAGSLFRGVWHAPAGESFIASLFRDANLSYFWNETKGAGSIPLSLETVLDKGHKADFWLECGLYTSKKQLLSANKLYRQFESFQNNQVYTIANKKGETGGIIYFEVSPVRPDLVLKDIIKITNPDLLPNYELTFFEKLK